MAISNNPVSGLTEYEVRHQVAHLAAAGRGEDLHRLLALETSEGRNGFVLKTAAR